MAAIDFKYSGKRTLKKFFASSGFGDSSAGEKIGDGSIQSACSRRKLLLVAMTDVIQPVVRAEVESDYRRVSKLMKRVGVFSKQKTNELVKILFFNVFLFFICQKLSIEVFKDKKDQCREMTVWNSTGQY